MSISCKYIDCPDIHFVNKNLNDRVFPDDFVDHIICGDCSVVLKNLPDSSINLIITSPPYFVNKSYENTWTFEEYSSLMDCVFKESYRIICPGGYAIFNFGDYFNKDRFYNAEIPSVYPASINYFQWSRDSGFDLQATRIWRKQFSRMSIPFVCNTHPRPVFDYEHIWTFRKQDGTGKEFVNDRKKSQRAVIGEDWTTSAKLQNHEAAFPIDLPLWAIDVYAKPNDIILDSFGGIGTTMLAAIEKKHKCIIIEKDENNCKFAHRRIRGQ